MEIYTGLNFKKSETGLLENKDLKNSEGQKNDCNVKGSQKAFSKTSLEITQVSGQKKKKSLENSHLPEPKRILFKSSHNSDSPFISELPSSKFLPFQLNQNLVSEENSNFVGKKSQKLSDFARQKDSTESWIVTNSKFLCKLNQNSDKSQKVSNKFNDSSLYVKS